MKIIINDEEINVREEIQQNLFAFVLAMFSAALLFILILITG